MSNQIVNMVILVDSEPMRSWLLSNITFGDVTLGLYMLMLILTNLNMVCSVRDSLCLYKIGFWMFKWVMFMCLYHEMSSIFGSNTSWCCCILSVSNCVLLSHRWLWWTWVMRLAREAKDGLFVHGLWCVWCLGPCGLPRVPATWVSSRALGLELSYSSENPPFSAWSFFIFILSPCSW